MDTVLARISPFLQLTRVTTAFAAIGNVWFVILWTRASERERFFAPVLYTEKPLWVLLSGGAVLAIGLFAFATILNDTLDLRRDRLLNPDRPLAAGRLSLEVAVAFVALTLLGAVLGSTILGLSSVLMCLFTAGTILIHTTAARYVPSVGLVTLGLIYGSHMMTANAYLVFVWPVLLIMAHALMLGAITHRLARKRPRLTRRTITLAAIGWLFWSGVLLYVGTMRVGTLWPDWVYPTAAIGPMLLALGFIAFAWNKLRLTPNTPRAADKLRRYGAFWVTLYGTAWLLGQGYLQEAGILASLTLAGFLGMTILREIYGLIEQPIGYRR